MNKLLNKISNLKCYKKLLAMLTAGMMFATPVAGLSESNESEKVNETTISEEVSNALLDVNEFNERVEKAYNYLTKFINYDSLRTDLQCLYYLVNREYMPDEDAKFLEENIVHGTDVANGEYQNFIDAYHLINVILDYNQSVIKNFNGYIDLNKIDFGSYDVNLFNKFLAKVAKNAKKYNVLDAIRDYNKSVEKNNPELVIDVDDMCVGYDVRTGEFVGKSIKDTNYDITNAITDYNELVTKETEEKLIDVSKLCFDKFDKELVHEMHVNYVNAYKAGKFDNEYYEMVFKQLTTLNAYEQAGNAHELSVGARWLTENVIGGDVMQMLRDHMQETYPREELDKYFVKGELNKGQWILRDDISLDLNCLKDELQVEVFQFGQLWIVVYTNVNNDIMNEFAVICNRK